MSRIIAILAALVVVGGIAYYLSPLGQPEPETPAAAAVDAAEEAAEEVEDMAEEAAEADSDSEEAAEASA